MKCLRCGKQNDYRTRKANGRACAACAAPFVFEPREGDPITDLAFQNAIGAVSDDGRLAWLPRHLYFEVARRVRRHKPLHRLVRRARVSVSEDAYASLFMRWSHVHGEPPGLLHRAAFAVDVRAEERARDAAAYGFERLLVCDREDTVDVLLANGFHGDHRCAVLAASGYPAWAYDLMLPRLRATPPTIVLVVHDADPQGCRLADEVRNGARWFRGEDVDVRDVGLRPADATRFRGTHLSGSGRAADALAMHATVEEARWLAKHRVELAAVRPRALLGVLARALSTRDDDASSPGDGMPLFVWGVGDGGGDAHGDGGGDGDGDG